MGKIQAFENDYLRKNVPDFKAGDTVKVHVRVVEGDRERIQMFQGTVIKRQGGGLQETFTVRKLSFGVGTERTFPVHSPMLAKIEVKARGTVRRAKLYYLRDRIGKKARIKEMFVEGGIPASSDITHSDAERKRLGLDDVVEPEVAETTEIASEPEAPRNDGTTTTDVPDVEAAAVVEETPVVAEEVPAEVASEPEAPSNDVTEEAPAETPEPEEK